MRNSVYIIESTIEALGLNTDDYPINTVTVHWDGKLLPVLDMRKYKEEPLAIVISYGDKEQLITVLKLDNSTESEQAQAVWNAVTEWNLEDKEQMMTLIAVNDTAEREVKLMQDFLGKITVEEEQKQFLLPCEQEHRLMYPDCEKKTLKRKYNK
ncbi:hypothetical protein EVAR_29722_1 [Eumeta japonica]|uniref:Uncharacterized protein n=1 Tax=Eumeta variegata TaxID=151549 RepID=A0A4C1VYR9_EUMVA|nr:hypothetical protein EVAR_29722_1 [Eumeta japonica]